MGRTFVDLSHTVYDGLMTYKGFPAPVICDFISRQEARKFYGDETSFQIGRIDMVANTGTYIDTPFHQFEDGKDLSEVELGSLAELEGVGVWATGMAGRSVGREFFSELKVRGKAVLVETGRSGY
jgi:arylformamidase